MDLIGVRFLMTGGAFLNVRMSFEAATEISNRWLTDTNVKFFRGAEPIPGGVQWAVKVDSIIALHTYAPEPLPGTLSQPAAPGQFRSGLQLPRV